MVRSTILTGFFCVAALAVTLFAVSAEAQAAGRGQPTDWERFYYYPYVYYPHSFQRPQGSYDHLYYRYPPNRRIPVYNQNWHNFYPGENPGDQHNNPRPYHKGHHFILDVF